MLVGKTPLIKLLPEEEVVAIQRQHVVAFLVPVAGLVITFAVLLFGTGLVLQQINLAAVSALMLYAFLLLLELFVSMGLYLFAYWYYQFYVITNQRLLHIHFFRLGGFHMDEVAYGNVPKAEVECKPSNPFYDLLGVEDVYVYFRRTDRPEPFAFIAPANAQVIENLLEEIVTTKGAS